MCVDGEPENNRKNPQKQPADPKNDFKKEELCSRRQPSCNHNVSVVHFATGRGKTGASFPPRQTKFLALAAPQASEQAGRVQQAWGPRAASDAPTAYSDHSHATDLSAAKGLCAWGRPAARQRVCDRSACCRLATRRPSRSSLLARFCGESQLTASVYSQASLHHHC